MFPPFADDCKVIFNALVIDVDTFFKERHRYFGVTNARSSGGHACGQPLQRPHSIGGSMGEVEHRQRRWSESSRSLSELGKAPMS